MLDGKCNLTPILLLASPCSHVLLSAPLFRSSSRVAKLFETSLGLRKPAATQRRPKETASGRTRRRRA